MALLLAGFASPAAAELAIAPEGFSVRLLDAGGEPEVRAGSHPDRLQIDFKLETDGTSARDIAIDMPPGFGGDPDAVPACPRQAHEEGAECPPESQVGTVSFGSATPLPIFLLEAGAGQVAAFTSKTGLPIPFELRLRSGDLGATFVAEDLAEGAPSEARIELWGIPADHQEGTPSSRLPFLTAPTVCGPPAFTLRVRSREEGAPWLSAGTEAEPLVGCESLAFAPRFGLSLDNPVADSPTGVRMALSMPEEAEGDELASARMRDVTVEMPPGLAVSPGGAAGLAVCTDSQLALGSDAVPSCPAAARVGTIELASTGLPDPLEGAVYLGEQRGNERFRLFVVASGLGTVFKFVASMRPDPETGRLRATLHDLPQAAIDRMVISLDGGPSGLMAAPLACGPVSGVARFVPYGEGPPVTSVATVSIARVLSGVACPGPLPFAPQLLTSSSSHRAGRTTSLSATVRRNPGEGLPARFSLTLPAGLSAALGSVQTCPDSLAGSGACPAASRLGTVRAEVGSGPRPAVLTGSLYAGGRHRNAPFSLVMALPAIVGPFDLGTVAFRAAARIDGRTGRVTVATDRLPDVVEGVAIRFQSIELALARKGLIRNPTSCGPRAVDVALESQEGALATQSVSYRVSRCRQLGFAPRVRATIVGSGRLRARERVGLRVSVRLRRRDTALRSLFLSLPPALKLGLGGLREICSRVDASRGLCPAGSKVGTAAVRTPLLNEPLRGSIHVVQPRDKGEPDLWMALAGGGVELTLRGRGASEDGRFATRLAGLPDMPLAKVTMRLGAPGRGVLSLDATPCVADRARRLHAELRLTGQNGARRESAQPIATGAKCGSAGQR